MYPCRHCLEMWASEYPSESGSESWEYLSWPCLPQLWPLVSFSLANLVTLELRENLLKSLPA